MQKILIMFFSVLLILTGCNKLPPNSGEYELSVEKTGEEQNKEEQESEFEKTEFSGEDTGIEGERDDVHHIDYEYFFRGFLPLGEDYEYMDELEDGMLGDCLIFSEEDWRDYAKKCCPVAASMPTPDFNEKCFYITWGLYGSRASANSSHDIEYVEVVDNHVSFMPTVQNDEIIYIENSHSTGHLFVNVIVLNRSDIPEHLENNIYTCSEEDKTSVEKTDGKQPEEFETTESTDVIEMVGGDETENSMEVEYFFRGFTPLWEDYAYTNELNEILGGCLIFSEEDWIEFKHRFCTAAGPLSTPDFNEKCFLALPKRYDLHASENSSFEVESVKVVDRDIVVKFATATPANRIYVDNTKGVDHLFVNVIVLNRSDIPGDVNMPIYARSLTDGR